MFGISFCFANAYEYYLKKKKKMKKLTLNYF